MRPADAILEAASEGDVERLRGLLDEDPSLVHTTGPLHKTPLHLAAEHDRPEAVRMLVERGASLKAETTRRMTPLELAAHYGSDAAARALLDAGAPLDLWAAAGLGLLEEVRGFWDGPEHLGAGAMKRELRQQLDGSWAESDSEEEDYRRQLYDGLYVACRNGHADVARFLLDKGAEIDHRAFLGATALHWAAGNGQRETVELLLERGARQDLLDEKYKATPRGWAEREGHPEVAELLAEG